MSGLILEKDRLMIKKEYIFRFFILLLNFLTLSIIITGITLAPSFLLLKVESESVSVILSEVDDSEFKIIQKDITDTIKKINLNIKKINNSGVSVSDTINLILNNVTNQVSINSVYFGKNNDKEVLRISGVAKSREDLLVFSKKLESQKEFESVGLPFSSFSKDQDIEFSADIILKPL